MLKLLCLILFTYISVSATTGGLTHVSSSENKKIFILAGQSNMSGRGGMVNGTWDGITPTQCRPTSAIRSLNAKLNWVKAAEPLHKDIDTNVSCGIGPGMAFAHSLLENDSNNTKEICLIPCAVGGYRGTRLSEWARGTFLYKQLVRRAKIAMRGGGGIQAMLWYQGESDTVNLQDAESYRERLKSFFLDVRKDLKSPELAIIQVAITSGQGPYVEKVRGAQLRLNLTNVRCIDAKGLELEPDHLHLSTRAEVKLGKMFAEAFISTETS